MSVRNTVDVNLISVDINIHRSQWREKFSTNEPNHKTLIQIQSLPEKR